jgi:hypothetical protein
MKKLLLIIMILFGISSYIMANQTDTVHTSQNTDYRYNGAHQRWNLRMDTLSNQWRRGNFNKHYRVSPQRDSIVNRMRPHPQMRGRFGKRRVVSNQLNRTNSSEK